MIDESTGAPQGAVVHAVSTNTSEDDATMSRRLRLAQLLREQASPLEAPPSGGGYVTRISPFAGAAKLLQAYAARKQLDALGGRGSSSGDLPAIPSLAPNSARLMLPNSPGEGLNSPQA